MLSITVKHRSEKHVCHVENGYSSCSFQFTWAVFSCESSKAQSDDTQDTQLIILVYPLFSTNVSNSRYKVLYLSALALLYS